MYLFLLILNLLFREDKCNNTSPHGLFLKNVDYILTYFFIFSLITVRISFPVYITWKSVLLEIKDMLFYNEYKILIKTQSHVLLFQHDHFSTYPLGQHGHLSA